MSALAVLARPDLRDMLIIGFGGGNVVQAVPPSVRHIDLIELEPEMIRANQAIAARRSRDPLSDTRLRLIMNDARGSLALTAKTYDAIVSQPSHPWTAGASHLYTREFLQVARAHLNPGGLYVGWMSVEYLDADLLRSMLATLHAVFPEVRVYRAWGNSLLFMASSAPIAPERYITRTREVLDSAALHFARIGLLAPEDLVATLMLDTDGAAKLADNAPLVTDDDNRLAVARAYERGQGLTGETTGQLLAPFDPLSHADSFVHRELEAQLDFGYIWRRCVYLSGHDPSTLERLSGLADALGPSATAVQLRYMSAMRLGQPQRAASLVAEGLTHWPQSTALRYLQVEPYLSDLAFDRATAEQRAQAVSLPAEVQPVLAGMRAAGHQDWSALAALDETLSRVNPLAAWGVQAAQLRVEWRARVQNPELRQRYGDEGIAMADRVLSTDPDAFWFALRALSAGGTNRPEVALESIAGFAATVSEVAGKLSASERALLSARAGTLAPALDALAGDNRVDARRVTEVRSAFDQAVDKLR